MEPGTSTMTPTPESEEPSFLDRLTGSQKSAYLLLSLPQEEAAGIIQHLDEESLQKIVTEMARIERIDPEQRAETLKFFQKNARRSIQGATGGMQSARSLLEKTLGSDGAARIMKKLDSSDSAEDFRFLETVANQVLSNLLASEHPQTVAIALANLKPRKSAEILKLLPVDLQKDVAMRLARTQQIHPDAVANLASSLRKRLENMQQEDYTHSGGVDSLARILGHLDRNLEEGILNNLEKEDNELVEQLREKLFLFEELVNLDIRELRLMIAEIPDDRILARALRGTGEETRRAFFAAMSQNRASDIVDEINLMGPTPVSEINEARRQVLEIARRLDELHEIVLKKDREEYI